MEQKYETNKEVIQRLGVQEDALVQGPGFGGTPADSWLARYNAFLEEQADAIAQVNADTLALKRKREDEVQEQRRKRASQQSGTGPQYVEDGGLLFPKKRLDQILEFRKQYPTPRSAADPHVEALASNSPLVRPVYRGTFYDPDLTDVAVVSYAVSGYHGKAVKNQAVHVFVFKAKGYWMVLELPGRSDSVLLGPPPSDFKRAEAASDPAAPESRDGNRRRKRSGGV